jgi:hypothetical protein
MMCFPACHHKICPLVTGRRLFQHLAACATTPDYPPHLPPFLPNAALNPDAILLSLRSQSETDVLSALQQLSDLISHNFDLQFPDLLCCAELSICDNPTITQASQQFLITLFSRHPMKLSPFTDPDFCDLFPRLLLTEFGLFTCKLIKCLLRSSAAISEYFFSDYYLGAFVDSICALPIDNPQLNVRLNLLFWLGREYPVPQSACREVLLSLSDSFPVLPAKLFREVLQVTLAVLFSLEDDDPYWLSFFDRNVFSNLISRYSPRDNRNSRLILLIILSLARQGNDMITLLLSAGIDSFFGQHYPAMEFADHRRLTAIVLKKIFICRPERQACFLGSEMAHCMISAISEEPFEVKEAILRLFCSLSQEIDVFVEYFLDWGLIDVYVECLKDASNKFRRYLIASLTNMLLSASRQNVDLFQNLVEVCEEAELTDVAESICNDVANEELFEAIAQLNDARNIATYLTAEY